MDYRCFYEWEKDITIKHEVLFSRPTPDQVARITVDKLPDEMNWIALVNRLSNDDITKHNDIYKINYVQCLQLLVYWHFKDEQTKQFNEKITKKK